MKIFSATVLVESAVPHTMVRFERGRNSSTVVVSRERLKENCGIQRATVEIPPHTANCSEEGRRVACETVANWIDGTKLAQRATVEEVARVVDALLV